MRDTILEKLVSIVNKLNLKFENKKVYVYSSEFPDNYNVNGYSKRLAVCVSYDGGALPDSSFRQPYAFQNRLFYIACRGDENLINNDIEKFLNDLIVKISEYSDDTIHTITLAGDIEDLGYDERNRSLMYYPITVKTIGYLK